MLLGCPSVPEKSSAGDTVVEAAADAPLKPDLGVEVPHPSENCDAGQMELDGECIEGDKAAEIIDQVSDQAVEQLVQSPADPVAQVEAQQTLTMIQEQRIEQAVQDTEEIKKIIQEKKRSGKLPSKGKDGEPGKDGKE